MAWAHLSRRGNPSLTRNAYLTGWIPMTRLRGSDLKAMLGTLVDFPRLHYLTFGVSLLDDELFDEESCACP